MLGWAAAYLSQPAPLVTLVVLAVLALAVHRRLADRFGWSPWATGAALLTLAAIAAITLPPGPGPGPGPGAQAQGPAWDAAGGCARSLVDPVLVWQGLTSGSRGERLANTVMFVPLTFFGVLAARRPVPVTVAAALLPLPIEMAQAVTDGGRICAGFDWATNALGALIGAVAAVAVLRIRRRRTPAAGEAGL
jgi:hypothetical protein